jgi:hypothetical protein
MAPIIVFKGRKYRLSDPGPYYRHHNWGKGGPANLHRAVWEDRHGPIPKGFDVHHRDGDGTNNELSNLELVERGDHQRQHTLDRYKRGELKPPGKLALKRAAAWHHSDEGLRWHSENGKRTWIERKWHLCECKECGRAFRSPYPKRAKFCHLNCKMADLRRRRGRPVGDRPNRRRTAELSDKQRPGT